GPFSNWNPSRGPSSLICTKLGKSDIRSLLILLGGIQYRRGACAKGRPRKGRSNNLISIEGNARKLTVCKSSKRHASIVEKVSQSSHSLEIRRAGRGDGMRALLLTSAVMIGAGGGAVAARAQAPAPAPAPPTSTE